MLKHLISLPTALTVLLLFAHHVQSSAPKRDPTAAALEEKPRSELIECAKTGRLNDVITLLRQGADPNAADSQRCTALHHAAENNHPEVVKALLNTEHRWGCFRVNPNATDNLEQSALHHAAKNGHLEVVKVLLEKDFEGKLRVNLKAVDKSGRCPWQYAEKNSEIEELLLGEYPDPTSLHFAASAGDTNAVKTLLDEGYRVNRVDNNRGTALHRATENGHLDVVKLLLERKADPNIHDEWGRAALHYAAEKGHKDVVRALVENGANINEKGMFGDTPIRAAALNGKAEMVKMLLNMGADPSVGNKVWNDCSIGFIKHDQEALEMLRKKGAKLDLIDPINSHLKKALDKIKV